MKLYFSAGSCGLASQIVLREAEQAFELVEVDFKTKTTVESDYFEVTPKGLVPALKLDDGEVFTESAIILQWIADKNPERNLLPSFGSRDRYKALEWLNFIASDLHKGMAVMFSPLIDQASKSKFAKGNLTSKFDYIEKHLSTHDYVLGRQFSVVDAYLYNLLRWPVRVNIDLSSYTSIRTFMVRMQERASVRASLEAEGIPPV